MLERGEGRLSSDPLHEVLARGVLEGSHPLGALRMPVPRLVDGAVRYGSDVPTPCGSVQDHLDTVITEIGGGGDVHTYALHLQVGRFRIFLVEHRARGGNYYPCLMKKFAVAWKKSSVLGPKRALKSPVGPAILEAGPRARAAACPL